MSELHKGAQRRSLGPPVQDALEQLHPPPHLGEHDARGQNLHPPNMSFQTVAPPSDVASNGPRLMHDRLPSFPPGCSFTTGPLLPPVRCCPLWEGGVAELDTSSPSGRPPLALPVTVTTRGPRSGSQSSVPGHQLWWRVVPQLPYQPLWRDVGGGGGGSEESKQPASALPPCMEFWSALSRLQSTEGM